MCSCPAQQHSRPSDEAAFGRCAFWFLRVGGGGVVQRFRPRHQHQVFERYRLGFEFCRAAIHPSPCACTRRSGGRQSSDTGGAAGVARLASPAIDGRSRDPPTHHSHLRLLAQGSLEFCRRFFYRAPGMEVRRIISKGVTAGNLQALIIGLAIAMVIVVPRSKSRLVSLGMG